MAQTVSRTDTRIARTRKPRNIEADFPSLDTLITPVAQHYVRNHFAVPSSDVGAWRLEIVGAVARPLTLTCEGLRALPATSRVVTLECAGNGRSFLTPRAPGVQWETGAVSTAEWTGVTLERLLEGVGVAADAIEVVAESFDTGTPSTPPKPAGTMTYHRSLALDDALARGALVAYAMNGAPLPAVHGFPARLVVPGGYGMASVKWLQRVILSTERFEGYWQTIDYAYWDRTSGHPQRTALLGMAVKSLIAHPTSDAQVARGAEVEVTGFAWSDGAITKVDVSTDGGTSWNAATLMDAGEPGVWRRWHYTWRTPQAEGATTLMSRATDSLGRVQPMDRNDDYGGYVIHHVIPVPVSVA